MSFGKNLTTGNITKNLITLIIPIFISGFIQTLYNIINTIWIGQLEGKNAVASSTVGFPIIFLLTSIASGISVGVSIYVSHLYGGEQYDDIKKVANTSYLIGFIVSILLTILSVLLTKFILKIMNTPIEILESATSYTQIFLVGYIFIYFNLLLSAILRGIGNTSISLVFTLIGTILSLVLNPILITGFKFIPAFGINGAAIASVLSMAFSIIPQFIFINYKYSKLKLNFKNLHFNKKIIKRILKLSIPSIMQQATIAIGLIIIISLINTFGIIVIAAYGATSKIDSFTVTIASALGSAITIITGQFVGSNQKKKIHEIFKKGLIIGYAFLTINFLIIMSFPSFWLGFFIKDDKIISLAVQYLQIIATAQFVIFPLIYVPQGIINGAGDTLVIMKNSMIAIIFIRIPLAVTLLYYTQFGINGIWAATIIGFIVESCLNLWYYVRKVK